MSSKYDEKINDYPTNHRMVAVYNTPKMVKAAMAMCEMSVEYERLMEKEQRRQFAVYQRLVRDKVVTKYSDYFNGNLYRR